MNEEYVFAETEEVDREVDGLKEDMDEHMELGYCPSCGMEIDNSDAQCDCYCHILV